MKNLIKNMFHDNREMKKINKLYNIYETNDNEIVAIRIHLGDFTPESLADYTEEAEELYDRFNKAINIYIAMDKNGKITVSEHTIKSEADFTIKLGQTSIDPCKTLLDEIKQKIKNKSYEQKDIDILQLIPIFAKQEDRKEIRTEVFKLLEMVLWIKIIL